MQRVYGTMYKLLTSGIVPRPVAFVSSISEAGVKNLAPFSWFNTVTHNPPIISISCSVIAGKSKDTALNIKETKGFGQHHQRDLDPQCQCLFDGRASRRRGVADQWVDSS